MVLHKLVDQSSVHDYNEYSIYHNISSLKSSFKILTKVDRVISLDSLSQLHIAELAILAHKLLFCRQVLNRSSFRMLALWKTYDSCLIHELLGIVKTSSAIVINRSAHILKWFIHSRFALTSPILYLQWSSALRRWWSLVMSAPLIDLTSKDFIVKLLYYVHALCYPQA